MKLQLNSILWSTLYSLPYECGNCRSKLSWLNLYIEYNLSLQGYKLRSRIFLSRHELNFELDQDFRCLEANLLLFLGLAYLTPLVSASGLGVQTLTSDESACPLTRMVMQENTKGLYWFGPRMPYVQCESRSLYCLAPESACSRGVQASCERGICPRSRLRE